MTEQNLKTDNLLHMAKVWDRKAQNCHRNNYSEFRYRAYWFRREARKLEAQK